MSGTEIGSAYIALYVTMPGVSDDIKKLLGATDMSSAGKDLGTSTAKGFSTGFAAVTGAIAGIVSSVTSKAISLVTDSIGSAVSRVDTLSNFSTVMSNLGYSASDASVSIDTMSTRLTGLPTALNDMASMVQQLAAITGSMGSATDIGLAFNDMMLASGSSTIDQANAFTQFTQILAKGSVDLQAWNSINTAMPGQLKEVATSLLGTGANATTLYGALQKGTISMSDFTNAIVALDSSGTSGMSSFSQQAKDATGGIATTWRNLQTAITRDLASAIAVAKPLILGVIGWATDGVNAIKPVITGFITWVTTAITAVTAFVSNGDFTSAFRQAFNVEEDSPVVSWLFDLRDSIINVANTALPILQNAFATTFAVIQNVVAWIFANKDWLTPLVGGIGVAVIALKAWGAAQTAWITISAAAKAAQVLFTAVTTMQTLSTEAATGAQLGLNTAIEINPISLIIGAIIGLVAGLVWFFTQTELGQQIWTNFTNALAAAWTWLLNSILQPVFQAIGAIFTWLWTYIIQPYINLIVLEVQIWANIFTWIWNSILSPVFQAIGAIFTWLWDYIIHPYINMIVMEVIIWANIFTWIYNSIIAPVASWIGDALTNMSNVISTVMGVVSSAWNSAWSGISSFFIDTWNNIISVVNTIGGAFNAAFSGIGGFVQNAFAGVVGFVRGPINAIIGIVNGAIDAIDGLSVTIPDWVPGVGGQTWNAGIPDIPYLASGGTLLSSGWAVVGEKGPELVNLPAGSTVYSNAESQKASGSNVVVNVNGGTYPTLPELGEALGIRVSQAVELAGVSL